MTNEKNDSPAGESAAVNLTTVPKSRVLVVDDEQGVRATLQAFLQQAGYAVETAHDAAGAQQRLDAGEYDVIVCDIVLPGLSGVNLVRRLRETAPHVRVIMMTGEPSVDTATEAVRSGATDYLSKPVLRQAILRSVGNAARLKRLDDERRRLAEENAAYQLNLEKLVQERTQRLEEALANWKEATEGAVLAMVSAVESRDPYTAGHQQRVALLARAMALEMGLPKEEAEVAWYAGLVHDLGKISVPAEILSHPGTLSESAMQLVREHPASGHAILKRIKFPWPLADAVLDHHERLDGSGYPRGLKGEQISRMARILGVADVVEAMASHRPYRPTLGLRAALEEIESGRGVKYDTDAVDACLRLFREKGFCLGESARNGGATGFGTADH